MYVTFINRGSQFQFHTSILELQLIIIIFFFFPQSPMERNGVKVCHGESFYSNDQMAIELCHAIQQLHASGTHRDQRKGYVNSLSSRQMESLTALCDTFLPSIDDASHITTDPSVSKFYLTSASIAGTPQLVRNLH